MIDEISSSSGSNEGGQLLTIKGKFFDETTSPAVVTVGGEACAVQSISDAEVVCLTPVKPTDTPTSYAGRDNSMFISICL